MKKIIAAVVFAFVSFNASAGDSIENLANFISSLEDAGQVTITRISKKVQPMAEEVSKEARSRVEYSSTVLVDAGSDIAQFVWAEIKNAQIEIQERIDSLEKRLNNHIGRDQREHARLQAQINQLKHELAVLKKQHAIKK